MTHSFHSRVLSVIVGLVIVAQVGTSTAVFMAARRTALGLVEQQLQITERLMQDVLESHEHAYRDSLHALAGDFGFREAVSSHDRPTIDSALANQGARIGADVVVLLDAAGQLIAATDSSLQSGKALALAQFLMSTRDTAPAPAIVNMDGRLVQFVVVPVRSPETVAWIGMGFVLRDFVAQQIKAIGGADISFIALNPGAKPGVAASTLADLQRTALGEQIQRLLYGADADRVLALQGEDYLTKVVPVSAGTGQAFFAVVQLPEQTVTAPLLALRDGLLKWGGAVTVLCLAGALLSARLLSRPIQALASTARSMQLAADGVQGDRRPAEDDVSSLAGALHALAHRTQYDSLTGLPNRTLFFEWLTAALSRAEREKTSLAVVFVDLEGFGAVNERSGRAMGDLVLRKVAQRLLRCVRSGDIVARLGADEFVLILDGVAQAGAVSIIDRMMPVIAKTMQSPDGPLQVSMRAGIAVYPDHARDRETLLRLADAARYESKARRQATVVARIPHAGAAPTPSTHDTWSGAPWEGADLATQPMRKLEIDEPGAGE